MNVDVDERRFWQAISERAAIMWIKRADPGVGADIDGPFGIVVWGDIDSAALQIGVSRFGPDRPGYPQWERDVPPTEDEIRSRWRASAGARARAEGSSSAAAQDAPGHFAVFEQRHHGERPADFYKRVADFYLWAQQRSGKPTRDLAEAAQVPKTTAARWVREARGRGFLPKARQGRTRL